ncbi:UPF0690 protein [Trichinella spiralis]|uniref:UPF0690 protein n=1 Tax=Trichinella spiralis TaxID=6334 RepID=A0ABR3KWC0_TRISP
MELEMRENLPAKKRCKDVVEIAKKLSKFSSSYIIYKKIDRKYYLTWAQYGNVENSVRSILNSSLLKFYKNPVIEIPLTVGCYVLSPTTGSVLCGRVTRVTDAVAVCIVYGIVTAKVYWTADGPSNVNLGDCIWFELTNYYSEHKYLVFEGNLVSENTATTKGCLEKFGYEADLMVGSWTTDNASRSYSGSKKIKFVDEENKTDVSSFDFTMPSSSSAFKKAEFKTASSLKEKLKTSSTDTNDIDEMKILSFEDSGCTPDAETSTSEKVNEPKNHKKKNQKLDSDALLLENMNETNCDDDHEELLKAHILGTGEEHVSEEAALTNGDDDLEKLNDTDTKLKKHKKKRKHNESPLPESSFRMQVNSESVDIINRILKMGAVNSNSDLIQSVVEEDVAKKMHEPKRKKIKMEI